MEEAKRKAREYSLITSTAEGQYQVLGRLADVVTSKYFRDGITEEGDWLNLLAARIGEWRAKKGFDTGPSNIPEKIALLHSEGSEMLEEFRSGRLNKEVYWEVHFKPEQAESVPKPCGFPIEMADLLIRLLDLADSLDIDLAYAVALKMRYNEGRPHMHGKKI